MTLIASILHLDRKAVKALRITDPYSVHRVVYSLYTDVRDTHQKNSSEASGILYADQGGDVRGRKILLLANREPLDSINGHYGEVQSKSIPQHYLTHSQYRFKVIVNPTRRDSHSRKLVAVRGREEIAKWFLERSAHSWGFDVDSECLQVDKVEVLQFKDKQKRRVTIGQAHLQGILNVRDQTKFEASFTHGIGRARAYGCGLLQLVPCTDSQMDRN